jgi:hypothetical protein
MKRLVMALGAGALALGCSSSDPGPSCTAYSVPARTDLTKPTVSFKSDVVPVFVQSCAFSPPCHGATSGDNQGVYLGVKTGDPKAALIYAGLVGKPSNELAAMPYVTPGDPSKSYVMHKMDGDQCTLDAQCTGGSCGQSMPQSSSAILPATSRDVVRRWIAQGAPNN